MSGKTDSAAGGASIVVVAAPGPQLEAVRELLRKYAQQVDSSKLCFQGFEQELATLPGDYSPPAGCLLLAELGGMPAACVALRRLDAARCEMKRLYVRAVFRGAGLAGLLVERIIAEARARGYAEMYLDTLPGMQAARLIYDMLGFKSCPPYLPEPTPGADCLVLELKQ